MSTGRNELKNPIKKQQEQYDYIPVNNIPMLLAKIGYEGYSVSKLMIT
jgi:hypothetical protein